MPDLAALYANAAIPQKHSPTSRPQQNNRPKRLSTRQLHQPHMRARHPMLLAVHVIKCLPISRDATWRHRNLPVTKPPLDFCSSVQLLNSKTSVQNELSSRLSCFSRKRSPPGPSSQQTSSEVFLETNMVFLGTKSKQNFPAPPHPHCRTYGNRFGYSVGISC